MALLNRLAMLAPLLLLAALGAQAQVAKVKLPVALDGLEPVISAKTMNYHYNKHYEGYINNTKAAFGTRKMAGTLTDIVKSVADPATVNGTVLRKQAGGAWNHGLYFKTFAAPNSAATKEAAISPALAAAIKKSFGGVEGLKKNVSTAAMGVFGSGWSWVCAAKDGSLVVVTTANQDNPLMGKAISGVPECTPILGIDVWEHAYYVDHGPARKDYVDNYWSVLNWPQVSANYGSATSGKVNDIVV